MDEATTITTPFCLCTSALYITYTTAADPAHNESMVIYRDLSNLSQLAESRDTSLWKAFFSERKRSDTIFLIF